MKEENGEFQKSWDFLSKLFDSDNNYYTAVHMIEIPLDMLKPLILFFIMVRPNRK
jgi:hypothetical protein